MKTITKNLYTFGELIALATSKPDNKSLKRAVETAREWLQEGQTNYDWWSNIYETWISALNQIGFTDADISFSGFWSQGDGASFTCKHVDLGILVAFLHAAPVAEYSIKGTETGEDFRPWLVHQVSGVIPLAASVMELDWDQVTASVVRKRTGGHYVHAMTCELDIDNRTDDIDRVNALADSVEQLRQDICHAIYRELETEYEWRLEDEQLIETSDSNEYTFDESGRREGTTKMSTEEVLTEADAVPVVASGDDNHCPESTDHKHEPDTNTLSVQYNRDAVYIDVNCKHCGRSGCIGKLNPTEVDW